MVNLRKAAIRLQKANSYAEEVKNTKKRLRISPSNEQLSSQEWQEFLARRQNGMDPNVDNSDTGCFLTSICLRNRQRKRRRLQFAGAARDKNNGNGGNESTYRGRPLALRQFSSTNQK